MSAIVSRSADRDSVKGKGLVSKLHDPGLFRQQCLIDGKYVCVGGL